MQRKKCTNRINYKDIIANVDNHKCPGPNLCTAATTCYEEKVRRSICLDCWLGAMEEQKIEVIVEGEYANELNSRNS